MKRLPDKVLESGEREISFAEELREDFVGSALTVRLDAERKVRWIEFYDVYGIARWSPERPLWSRKWDDPEKLGGWVKHYPATLLDGGAPNRPEMVETILAAVKAVDDRLAELIRLVMASPLGTTMRLQLDGAGKCP